MCSLWWLSCTTKNVIVVAIMILCAKRSNAHCTCTVQHNRKARGAKQTQMALLSVTDNKVKPFSIFQDGLVFACPSEPRDRLIKILIRGRLR